jgi:hypothetical protein
LGILDLDLFVKGTDPDSEIIRILQSSSKIVRKILDFQLFCDFFMAIRHISPAGRDVEQMWPDGAETANSVKNGR